MCGLAGFIGMGDRDDLLAMTRAIAHRGPDGEGLFIDARNAVHLGHRRLAIIDIAGGAQPMLNREQDCAVIFNGEIYNHLELRAELTAKGHRFLSDHSDTEVLLHGWREWGPGLPLRLNGMFAFAIWDSRQRALFLARDRFGEKPLYWARQGGSLYFASELSALGQHRHFRAEVDLLSQQKLLAHGFIPAPNAYWRDARKLRPGHWLRYDAGSQVLRDECYWRFAIEPRPVRDEAEAEEELRHLLRQAVSRRLMSDVPLGVFLSGGIDSSAVTAFAAAAQPGLQSFALGFDEPSYDESAHAAVMAAAAGTRHHAERLSLSRARDLMPDLLTRLDEPLGDPSLLPTFALCRFARRHVTVALSGDGGDELFAGYDTFAALAPARLYQRLIGQAGLHRGIRALAELLPQSGRNMSPDYRIRRALQGLDAGPAQWHPRWLAPLAPTQIAELWGMPVHAEDLYAEALEIWEQGRGRSLAEQGMEFYTRLYLPDAILQKVDRAAMLNGLEVRAVFLDNDLADFARTLPTGLKLRGSRRKYLLKRALRGLLPASILARRKKGFGIPLRDWMRELPAPAAVFPPPMQVVWQAWHERHRLGRADFRQALWCWHVMARHPVQLMAGS